MRGLRNMKEPLSLTVIGASIITVATDDRVITASALENAPFLGMTYGAWFKVALGISVVFLIVERGYSIILKHLEARSKRKEDTKK